MIELPREVNSGLLQDPSLELDLDRLSSLGCHGDRLPIDQFVHLDSLVPRDRPLLSIQLPRYHIAGVILTGLGQPGLLDPIRLLLCLPRRTGNGFDHALDVLRGDARPPAGMSILRVAGRYQGPVGVHSPVNGARLRRELHANPVEILFGQAGDVGIGHGDVEVKRVRRVTAFQPELHPMNLAVGRYPRRR
jgi:hypothetical protein